LSVVCVDEHATGAATSDREDEASEQRTKARFLAVDHGLKT
jgi:hypothetical protein